MQSCVESRSKNMIIPKFRKTLLRLSCNNSILLALTLEQEVYFSVRPWTCFLNQQGHIGISRFGEYCWETGIYGARMNSVLQPAAGVCCSSLLATTSTLGYHREFTFDICQVRRQAGEGSSEQAGGEEKGEESTGPARIGSSWYLPNNLSLSSRPLPLKILLIQFFFSITDNSQTLVICCGVYMSVSSLLREVVMCGCGCPF